MMDVPTGPWTNEDVRYWTQTPTRYCPWKDVARLFCPLDKADQTGTGMLIQRGERWFATPLGPCA